MQSKKRTTDGKIQIGDLPAIRGAMRGYRDYLKARGSEPSDFWVDRVAGGLADAGLPVRKRTVVDDGDGESGDDV